MKAKKVFSLEWVFEAFADHPTFATKRMFGGLAAYAHGRMMCVLMESPGETSYRDQSYPFEIWNGVLICTSREHHESLLKDFPSLQLHPVLPKWLYLPMSDPDFESLAMDLAQNMAKNDMRLGIEPSARSKKTAKKSKKRSKKI